MLSTSLPPSGIDHLLSNESLLKELSHKRIGILTNQSALTQNFEISTYALHQKIGKALKVILTPEHGWSGLIGEGVSVEHGFDEKTQLPIISLFGNSPWKQMLKEMNLETIIVDLQDVGLRCYTFGLTCAKVMDAFAGSSLEIIVCDRPNPLGSSVKGPVLESNLKSFVGHFEIPLQHGKTLGLILAEYNKKTKLSFSHMSSEASHNPFKYAWIPPSPNLPSWESVLLYPALVMLEGTNISEGRGTTLPFTSLGAPHLNPHKLVDFINETHGKSLKARPITFTPLSRKYEGKNCTGAHLLIKDVTSLEAYTLGIDLLSFLRKEMDDFTWVPIKNGPPDTFFVDYLLGTKSIRHDIENKTLNSQRQGRVQLCQNS